MEVGPGPGPNRKRNLRMVAMRRKRKILERDGKRCRYCETDQELTIDHVLPLSRGGTSRFSNLAVACMACNKDKGSRTHEEYLLELQRRKRVRLIERGQTKIEVMTMRRKRKPEESTEPPEIPWLFRKGKEE